MGLPLRVPLRRAMRGLAEDGMTLTRTIGRAGGLVRDGIAATEGLVEGLTLEEAAAAGIMLAGAPIGL